MKICTCQTADRGDGTPCENYQRGFVWDDEAYRKGAEETGSIPSDVIFCGACGQPITDMVDAPADHPTPPNTFDPPPEPDNPPAE